jgi:hypothetical protein
VTLRLRLWLARLCVAAAGVLAFCVTWLTWDVMLGVVQS